MDMQGFVNHESDEVSIKPTGTDGDSTRSDVWIQAGDAEPKKKGLRKTVVP
jgi:hypothetical protein